MCILHLDIWCAPEAVPGGTGGQPHCIRDEAGQVGVGGWYCQPGARHPQPGIHGHDQQPLAQTERTEKPSI